MSDESFTDRLSKIIAEPAEPNKAESPPPPPPNMQRRMRWHYWAFLGVLIAILISVAAWGWSSKHLDSKKEVFESDPDVSKLTLSKKKRQSLLDHIPQSLDRPSIQPNLNRGIDFVEAGDFASAIAEFDEAIRLDPKNAEAYFDRAVAWFRAGKQKNGLKDVREGRRLCGIPDVKLFSPADKSGLVHGVVHNNTNAPLSMIRISVTTESWVRNYDVSVAVDFNTTASFSFYVGEQARVQSFFVLNSFNFGF